MKKPNTTPFSIAKIRLVLLVVLAVLLFLFMTATAFMKNPEKSQATTTKDSPINRAGVSAQNVQGQQPSDPTAGLWSEVAGISPSAPGPQTYLQPERFRSFTLNRTGMERVLANAPLEYSETARKRNFIISLPAPKGGFQRFAVQESPVMEPGLAKLHPDIKTYSGRGIDDPTATLRMDLTPMGFHASVRGQQGSWFIDPRTHLDQSLYIIYFGRDLPNPREPLIEPEITDGANIKIDEATYRSSASVTLSGDGLNPKATITITIFSPNGKSSSRTILAETDDKGSFKVTFAADPENGFGLRQIDVSDGTTSISTSYEVINKVRSIGAPLVPTGDVLRTYRLALITDPGYATFQGGPANVTAAKVTLINRVTQVYEDDLGIRLVLIANNDLLNLDTWDKATGPNGPCGSAPCFTQSQVTGCSSTTRARFVVGQIVGASNYDVGHLALGQPGGGVANLGVVGRSNKAGGCTGIPTPIGDFYAIDYVAHEMGHQFSGNHPFNGNQLNCAGGNRSASTSVEPGSGSSIMAYAGICLTDDLQRHSDPYFSQRSLQEISTYTSSSQSAINEVQTASLVHFGGGNEVQVVTFGPGYGLSSTIRPLSMAINAAPSATSRGGAEEIGNLVTITTGSGHTLLVGDTVTVSGVGVAGYNGTWTVTAVPSSRSFQFINPTAGLATSGGGTITLGAPGATEVGNIVTIRTAAVHNRSVGDIVVISGVGVASYNGTFTVTAVPTARTFEYTNPAAGLANSGSGSAAYSSPFQVRIGGNDSTVIGGSGVAYTNANIQAAINSIPGFLGTVTVSAATATGFTATYGGASAGVDVPNFEIVSLSCGGCFASVEETNHGGMADSFRLNYNGSVSATITNGVNYTAAGILAALTPILPAGATATVAGFAGGTFNNTGFQITFGGNLAATNVPVTIALQDFSGAASGFAGETDKGGAVDNKGGIITPTLNSIPVATVPLQFTIPLRTPFALTGSATDADGDALLYSWEQNDRGGAAGTSLLINTKTNGPLFAMFSKSGQISDEDTLLYGSPGENHLTTNPTRVFPDLQQILDDNTNALTGLCSAGPVAPPVPVAVNECFAEFLPTADYVGFAGVNASPLSLHFRFTARDGLGGVNSADTTLLIDNTAGPLRVTSQGAPLSYLSGSTQTITWNVNNTDRPALAPNVMIALSTDGGLTYPHVLTPNTPNNGSANVTLPNVSTTQARIKVEAVDNIFFDVNHSDFSITANPVVTNSLGGGSQSVQYSDSVSPDVTITATDIDSLGSLLNASVSGLPGGLSLEIVSTTDGSTLPGNRTWKVAGTALAAPGSYPVTVTVEDDSGGTGSTSFTIVVTKENADTTYAGDNLAFTPAGGAAANVLLRAVVIDRNDGERGDIRNANVSFKEGATTLCAPIAVALINGDTTIGTANCTTSLPVGSHSIDVLVDGYYTGSASALVEVAQPDGSFITGGGHIQISSSAGTYAADDGSLMNFAFNVKYNGKNMKNLQGHANIMFRAGNRTYQIKSTALDSLGIALKGSGGNSCSGPPSMQCFGLADFRSKANLQDVTDPSNPISLGGNLTLQITLTDKGEPGAADAIGVTLWSGNKLFFASDWTGSNTLEATLKGGNLVVH